MEASADIVPQLAQYVHDGGHGSITPLTYVYDAFLKFTALAIKGLANSSSPSQRLTNSNASIHVLRAGEIDDRDVLHVHTLHKKIVHVHFAPTNNSVPSPMDSFLA
jgi:hypothetical protein